MKNVDQQCCNILFYDFNFSFSLCPLYFCKDVGIVVIIFFKNWIVYKSDPGVGFKSYVTVIRVFLLFVFVRQVLIYEVQQWSQKFSYEITFIASYFVGVLRILYIVFTYPPLPLTFIILSGYLLHVLLSNSCPLIL